MEHVDQVRHYEQTDASLEDQAHVLEHAADALTLIINACTSVSVLQGTTATARLLGRHSRGLAELQRMIRSEGGEIALMARHKAEQQTEDRATERHLERERGVA